MGRKQYIIIGLGRFGRSICETLYESGADVMAMDVDEARVDSVRDISTHAVCADSMDENTLKQLGISDFDVAVVNIGGDVKASGVTTMLLKEMGVKTVIAKACDETHGRLLYKLGADKVVYPERDMGRRMAHNLYSANIMDFIEVSPDYSLSEIKPLGRWIGKSLGQLAVRAKYGINIVAIRSGDDLNASPDANTVLNAEDVLLVMSSADALDKLKN